MSRYNFHLAARFVKDFNYPIAIVSDPDIFYYELYLYDEHFGTGTRWEKLWELLDKNYKYMTDDARAQQFLEEYAKVRDNIINSLENNEKLKSFNLSRDFNEKWKIDFQLPVASNKSAYNQLHIGKRFISVDMKNANFQALKYAGIIDEMTYADFIGQFCDGMTAEYISESKYTRQVIFGKLNPKRQITVEKYIMSNIFKNHFMDLFGEKETKLVYFGSDEFVIEETEALSQDKIDEIIKSVKEEMNIDIRIESYELSGYEFSVIHTDGSKHKLGEFYRRSCDKPGKFKCVPLPYHKIIYKIMNGKYIDENYDTVLMYEKCKVKLLEDIVVEEIKNLNIIC